MLAPQDDPATPGESDDQEWLHRMLAAEDGGRDIGGHLTPRVAGRDEEHGWPAHVGASHRPLVEGGGDTRSAGANGRLVDASGPQQHTEKVDLRALASLVATIDSRVVQLADIVEDLCHRVDTLEVGHAPAVPRTRAQPLPPRFASQPQPLLGQAPFPSPPFPHSALDGGYHRSVQQRHPSPNGDELTPPASPQVQARAHVPLSRVPSLAASSSSSGSLGRQVLRERTFSRGQLHFTAPDAPSTSQVPPFAQPALPYSPPMPNDSPLSYSPVALHQHGPSLGPHSPLALPSGNPRLAAAAALQGLNQQTLPPTEHTSARGGWSGHVVRERSVSLAELRSTLVQGGRDVEAQAGPNALHQRSISLGSNSYQARPPLRRQLELPNYRALLETDADIDSEAFVCRILAHNDQQCSLFLQQRVRSTATQEKRQELFDAVGRHVLELSLSKFGNFLVSRCLEAGDSALAQAFEDAVSGHFLQLSVDPFGCHVVQKLLDCGGPATKDKVVAELLPHPHILTTKSSLHVLNRVLTTPNPPALFERLAEVGKGQWPSIVREEGGSLVVQHMFEDWADAPTSAVAREVLDSVDEVARTPCGSFVVAHLLERNPLPFCTQIMQHAPQLAADPYGAKVVDKCLRTNRAGPAGIGAFVEAVAAPQGSNLPLLVAVASHSQGAQLLTNLLTGNAAPARHKDVLGRAVLESEGQLLSAAGAHGARLVGLCRKALVA
ncbi:armadillo-type protein [Rhodotorula diobovata]|nr:armadillo-type protein [Rhodotorula diobovata]